MGWPVWRRGPSLCAGKRPAEGGWATIDEANRSSQT